MFARSLVRPVSAIAIAAAAMLAPSFSSATEDYAGAWLIGSTSGKFPSDSGTSSWQYTFDAQARYFDFGSGINQYLLRPGVGYKFDNGISAWGGYARIRARGRSETVVDENRYWQQIDWSSRFADDGTLTLRGRLEQRDVSAGDDVALNLRLLTRYTRPISESGKIRLVLGVEPFFDLKDTDWGGEKGLGQLRSFIGIGWPVSDRFALETGYMNQNVRIDNGENINNHLAILNIRFTP